MAKTVEFRKFRSQDSRADLKRRIDAAPMEHADAILGAYNLLERLHEKGMLAALDGALASSDAIVTKAADAIAYQEAVTAARLALLLGGLLRRVDPEEVSEIINEPKGEAQSLFAIGRMANAPDVRRGMTVGLQLLGILGRAASATADR